MKIQIDLSKKANVIASLYKTKRELKTKKQAINEILELYGKEHAKEMIE